MKTEGKDRAARWFWILEYYTQFAAGEPIANIRRAAQRVKAEINHYVV